MSVASQSLMDNVTYVDLYKRWEQGNWSAYDIDFSEDRNGWEALSDIQRRSAMWIYSMFYYGEDRVADTLAPYINAAPTELNALTNRAAPNSRCSCSSRDWSSEVKNLRTP